MGTPDVGVRMPRLLEADRRILAVLPADARASNVPPPI